MVCRATHPTASSRSIHRTRGARWQRPVRRDRAAAKHRVLALQLRLMLIFKPLLFRDGVYGHTPRPFSEMINDDRPVSVRSTNLGQPRVGFGFGPRNDEVQESTSTNDYYHGLPRIPMDDVARPELRTGTGSAVFRFGVDRIRSLRRGRFQCGRASSREVQRELACGVQREFACGDTDRFVNRMDTTTIATVGVYRTDADGVARGVREYAQ